MNTATEPRHFFEALKSSNHVDAASGTIRKVSLISLGEARGHKDEKGRKVFVDETTLEQVFAFCRQEGTIKVKTDHGSGVLSTIGYLDSFSQEPTRVVGNLHIYDAEPDATRIFEIAEKNPTHLGISLEFTGLDEVDDRRCLARCDEVITAALVSDAAANKSLYSRKGDDTSKDSTQSKTPMPKATNKLSTDQEPEKKDIETPEPEKKEPTLGEVHSMLSSHMKDFEEFKSKFEDPNKVGDEGSTPKATSPDTEPHTSGDNDIPVKKDFAGDADKDKEKDKESDEKKLQRAAELGAEKAIKAFAARFGTKIPTSGAPASSAEPVVKTFAVLVDEATKEFAGDKDKAMLHCLKKYPTEYAASRPVAAKK